MYDRFTNEARWGMTAANRAAQKCGAAFDELVKSGELEQIDLSFTADTALNPLVEAEPPLSAGASTWDDHMRRILANHDAGFVSKDTVLKQLDEDAARQVIYKAAAAQPHWSWHQGLSDGWGVFDDYLERMSQTISKPFVVSTGTETTMTTIVGPTMVVQVVVDNDDHCSACGKTTTSCCQSCDGIVPLCHCCMCPKH